MSKQISAAELAQIVTRLLTDTDTTGELDAFETFQGFMTDIAKVVCDYCGGEVREPADNASENTWLVGVHGNDSLPSAFGGIWREYDPEGKLFDDESECSQCGAQVSEVIGCPDGQEVCQQCFDAGSR